MRKLAITVVVLTVLCLATLPTAFADTLQDGATNINGSFTYGSLAGTDASGFNVSTGVGTITVTVAGGTCASGCNVDLWLFDPAAIPFFNEYGATTGSASAGESYAIDVPDYDSDGNITGTILGNMSSSTFTGNLGNYNNVPGTVSNYGGGCGANGGGAANANCDDAVSMALGFNFADPGAGNEEVVTFEVSTTGCALGGICLETVQPVDGNNTASSTVYYSAVATSQSVCTGPSCGPPPPMPEPSSLLLLGTSLLGFAGFRKRQ